MGERQKNLIALSIIPQVFLVKLLARYPEFVETYYSDGIYRFISKTMRFVFGWIPFSMGDILYTLAIIYALRWLYSNRRRIISETKYWLRDVMISISLLYFGFHMLWGFNYYRLPLHQKLSIGNTYTTEELTETVDILIEMANAKHRSIVENDTVAVVMPYDKVELIENSDLGYEKLPDSLSFLNPEPSSLKASIYSLPLTYMGFSGYLNPFTNEAQVDDIIPLHKLPVTSCHEQAHQIGFAAENEANYIGYLSTISHPDPYYQYSGYIFGLKYCLYELARRDRELFEQKIESVNLGIRKNYSEEQEFWQSYQNPLEPLFKTTFNTFLKVNSQEDGIKSYSYIVALLVNTYKG